jgi:hypothetical protein
VKRYRRAASVVLEWVVLIQRGFFGLILRKAVAVAMVCREDGVGVHRPGFLELNERGIGQVAQQREEKDKNKLLHEPDFRK